MNSTPARRRLYIVWILFAVLLAGILIHEVTGIFEPALPPHTHIGRLPMFAFREPDLGRVEVMHKGQSTALMRDTSGAWFHHSASHGHQHEHDGSHDDHRHTAAAAHGAQPITSSTDIAQRINVIARMLADRRVKPEQSLDHYGLTNPQTMIAFYSRQKAHASQPLAVLYVGDLLPDQYTYYTKQPWDSELALIPRYYIALVLALAFGQDQAPTPLPVREGKG